MATVTSSVRAAVPATFADREWREFVRRSLFDNAAIDGGDIASIPRVIDAESGTVTFKSEPDREVQVTVELDYTPPDSGGPEVGEAKTRLDRDLERFRAYVVRRCDETHCRG